MISDSSVLIHLGKIGELNLLRKLYDEIEIPPRVKTEVVDNGRTHPESLLVKKAIKDGWIKVIEVREKEDFEELGIDQGEEDVIGLAVQKDEKKVLIDDNDARIIAKAFGLKPQGLISVLLTALKIGLLDFEDYKNCLSGLTENGFYLSQDVYMSALSMGEDIKP